MIFILMIGVRFIGLVSIMFIGMLLKAQPMQSAKHFRIIAISKADSTLRSTSNIASASLPMNLSIPTAFSPNNDGLNDTFGVLSNDMKRFKMRIFNRWGEVVFETDNVNSRWDGYFKGDRASEGVYGYELEASNYSNESVKRTGSVTLVY